MPHGLRRSPQQGESQPGRLPGATSGRPAGQLLGTSPTGPLILELQQRAGNQAVGQAVAAARRRGAGALPVQRGLTAEDHEARTLVFTEILGQGGDIQDTTTSAFELKPGGDVPGGNVSGIVGGLSGTVTSTIGLGFSSKELHHWRRHLAKAEANSVEYEQAKENRDNAAVDVVEQALSVSTGGTTTTLLAVGQRVADLGSTMSGGAAIAGLPLAAFTTVRSTIGLAEASQRFKRLDVLKLDAPPRALSRALSAVRKHIRALETSIRWWRFLRAGAIKGSKWRTWLDARIEHLQDKLDVECRNAVKLAKQVARNDTIKSKAAQGDGSALTPALIGLYARAKSHKAQHKQAWSMISGALGVGGGIALAVAAFAAGAALLATPIGWALGAAAAAIGLILAVYKFARWAHKKRHNRTDERTAYATRLLQLAKGGDPVAKAQAGQILDALGLSGLATKGGTDAAKIDLIKARLASQ